jgi:hypothetical protein
MRFLLYPSVVLLVVAGIHGEVPAAQPSADRATKDRELLQNGDWERASKSKDGQMVVEMRLVFVRDQLRYTMRMGVATGAIRIASTSARQYGFRMSEKEPVITVTNKNTEKQSTLNYELDGDKLLLKGQTPEGFDLSGEWLRKKPRS